MKPLAAISTGQMHQRQGTASQDAQRFWLGQHQGLPAFIGVVADGAGSTSHGGDGAQFICDHLVASIASGLEASEAISEYSLGELLPEWIASVRERLVGHAVEQKQPFDQFSSTCLLTIVIDSRCFCAQVGDGAIVAETVKGMEVAFWPENGQYANETYFLTSDDWRDHLRIRSLDQPLLRLAMFTDGVQNLLLRTQDRAPNGELLQVLFDHVESLNVDERAIQLKAFLDSLTNVSEDDKTLLLLVAS